MRHSQTLGFLVNKLARLLATDLERRLRPYDVTPAQWAVLAALAEHDGLAQTELEHRFGVGAATVSGVVQRMAQQGLVERRSDPRDKRVQRVYATSKGRAILPDLATHAEAVNARATADFSADERAFFNRLLLRATANLEGHE